MAAIKKKGGKDIGTISFRPKTKKRGKAKKSWGPKQQKPKAYRAQGR